MQLHINLMSVAYVKKQLLLRSKLPSLKGNNMRLLCLQLDSTASQWPKTNKQKNPTTNKCRIIEDIK